MEVSYDLIYVIITLVLSAFFSGMEIAFISSNKLQIELQNKQGDLTGKVLSVFMQRPGQFIGTTLMGNTISLVLYGIFMAYLMETPLKMWLPDGFNNDAIVLFLQTIISTVVVLITAEFLPKSLFMLNPNSMLNFFALPFLIIYTLFYQ